MSIARLSRLRIIDLPLRNPNFGLYSVGSAMSLIGMWMQRIAVRWLTWQLTGSGFWLGVVAFADFFPVVVIGPIAGAAADRRDQLTVVKISQSISLLQATLLFWLTAAGHMTVELAAAGDPMSSTNSPPLSDRLTPFSASTCAAPVPGLSRHRWP
jgi:hypothetical protein